MSDVPLRDVTCPQCDAPVSDERKQHERLRALGYLHEDYTIECENGHTWTHGVPDGEPETTDEWTCDACGDHYVPRDVFHSPDGRIHFVVKCQNCYYKPDQPLHFRIPEDMGKEWGILLGHPAVCGNTEDAERERRVQLTMER